MKLKAKESGRNLYPDAPKTPKFEVYMFGQSKVWPDTVFGPLTGASN